jgi:hypothetical protein
MRLKNGGSNRATFELLLLRQSFNFDLAITKGTRSGVLSNRSYHEGRC